ncbi:MAG: T9SS type A sorting domain-containing protein [Bacteroidota bacterium]
MNTKNLLLTLAIPVALCQGLKAQTTASRLVGQANWHNNGVMFVRNDSTAYTYSGNRGGDLNHQLKYDNATNWVYLGDTAYNNAYNYIQEFDSLNNLVSTVSQYWNGSSWVNFNKTLNLYTAGKISTKLMQTWGGSSWVNVAQNLYSYDAAGRVYSDQYQTWFAATSSFTPNTQIVNFYDLGGNKTTELTQVYNAGLGTYDYSARRQYAYSATNQLLTTTYSTWNGSAWVNNSMYTSSFDTSGNRTTQLFQMFNTATSAWTNTTLQVFSSFTAMQMPQMEVLQTWDTAGGGTWKNSKQYTRTYNSFGQLTSMTGISWNPAGLWEFASGDPMNRYYYATYTTASVTAVANNGGEANVYPVPAQGMLNIDLTWKQAQSATITIVDVQGRVIRNWETTEGTQYHSSIAVDNFAAGTYMILINGTTEGRIVKQLVVAH